MAVAGARATPSAARATRGEVWSGFVTALRLGWAVEANWTDPFLFVVYSVAKPLATALILVVMFLVISGGRRAEYLAFIVVGSAFWNLVYGSLSGFVQAMLEDRERYRMLKYVYVAPAPFLSFLVGRAAARFSVTGTGAALTLAVGIIFLGVRIDPWRVHWPMLVLGLVVGVVTIVALGVLLAGLVLQMRQESWSYPEAIAGTLYLLSGAVFPIDVLPAFLHPVALANPVTWWLEVVRRALIGEGAPGMLASYSDATVTLIFLATSIVTTVVCAFLFGRLEHRARERGLIDQVTGS